MIKMTGIDLFKAGGSDIEIKEINARDFLGTSTKYQETIDDAVR